MVEADYQHLKRRCDFFNKCIAVFGLVIENGGAASGYDCLLFIIH